MGPRHSKRSLDMAGTPTKGEIEGVGNAGKLEKIVDGIVEKVAANGHLEGDIQNGAEPLQNGLELIQNGEAATVAAEHSLEKINLDEKEKDEAIVKANGEMDEKLNGESEERCADAEGKDDKKEKKKDKKEKVVKKKFSFRGFSFSKKDKTKPKEEKMADSKDKTGIEETPEGLGVSAEVKVDESKEAVAETAMRVAESMAEAGGEDLKKEDITVVPSPILVMTVDASVADPAIPELANVTVTEKVSTVDDLPPPLPASPPPTEVKEEIPMQQKEEEEIKATEESSTLPQGDAEAVAMGTTNEVLTTTELIEEKATDLLKAVEEKVEESKRNETETVEEVMSCDLNGGTEVDASPAAEDVAEVKGDSFVAVTDEGATKTGEAVPEALSAVLTLPPNAEETPDKSEEFGAGESLAEMDAGTEGAPNASEVVVAE